MGCRPVKERAWPLHLGHQDILACIVQLPGGAPERCTARNRGLQTAG
jgi:hypothetical protein